MKIKKLLIFSMIGSLLPMFASASMPSQEILNRVQANMAILVDTPDAEPYRSNLLADIKFVNRMHGIEGIAWMAFQDPFLMQTFISSESTGLENISISLLASADDEAQLHDMLTALVRAQVSNDMDPQAEKHLAFYKRGIGESSVTLADDRLEQLIAESITAGLDLGRMDVAAATGGSLLTALQRLKNALIAELNEVLIPVTDEIFSQTHNRPT